jgi:hypothetical protein
LTRLAHAQEDKLTAWKIRFAKILSGVEFISIFGLPDRTGSTRISNFEFSHHASTLAAARQPQPVGWVAEL